MVEWRKVVTVQMRLCRFDKNQQEDQKNQQNLEEEKRCGACVYVECGTTSLGGRHINFRRNFVRVHPLHRRRQDHAGRRSFPGKSLPERRQCRTVVTASLRRVDRCHTKHSTLLASRGTTRVRTDACSRRVGGTDRNLRVDTGRARFAAGQSVARCKTVSDRALTRVRPRRTGQGHWVQSGRSVGRTGTTSGSRTRAAACGAAPLVVTAVGVVVVCVRVVVAGERVMASIPVRRSCWERRRQGPGRRVGYKMSVGTTSRVRLEAAHATIQNILDLGSTRTTISLSLGTMRRRQMVGRQAGARVERRNTLAARAKAVAS